MAREGGRVQLEQSDMCLALNFAKMAKRGFSRTTIKETQHLIKKTRASVREETTRGVEFSGHNKVMAMIGRHLAMVRKSKWMAAFLADMAPETIHRSAVGEKTRGRLRYDGRHLVP
jgi:saccharopine dehydrogenase-like NADP-dependent oxidoreductase